MTTHRSRVSTTSKNRSNADRWFYVVVTMFVILVNVVAFSPSLLNPSARTVPLPLTSLDLAHSLVSVTWLLVFLAQVTLVAAGRVTVHRRLGVLGVLLSAAFIVVTWLVLVEGARRGFDLSGDLVPHGTSIDPGTFLAPSGALIPFGAFVAAAVWYRQRPALHKRADDARTADFHGSASRACGWPLAGVRVLCADRRRVHVLSPRNPRSGVGASHPSCLAMGCNLLLTVDVHVSRSLSADGRVAQFR